MGWERSPAYAVTAVRFAIALLGCLLVAPDPASAIPHRFGLVFRDARTITLDWDTATAGHTAKFCNVDRVAARPIRALALDFGFKRDKKELSGPQEREVVSATLGAAGPLRPGLCRKVTLRTSGTVDPGTYTGVLSVVSGRVGHAHRAVTITVPEPKPTKVAAVGFTDPVAMEATRTGFTHAELEGNGHLLLRPAQKDQELNVPLSCPDEKSEQDDEKCPFLGNLINGSDYALVYVDGALDGTASDEQPPRLPAELPIRLEDTAEIGEYTGALDLAGTPSDTKDDVKLTATVTDPLGYAIVAFLIGVVFSLVPQFLLRRRFPERRLRDRWSGFKAGYSQAKDAFDAHEPKLEGFGVPTDTQRKEYERSIEQAIHRYGRSVVWFEEGSEAAKQIDASLDGVDADIAAWSDKDALHASLTKLRAKLDEIAAFLNTELPLQRAPAIRAAGAALLKPRTLGVGEATTTVAAAAAQTALLTEWLVLAKRAKRYAAWIELLTDGASAAEKDVLRLATLKLGEAVNELLDAEDAADMKRLRVAKDLGAVYDRLAPIGVARGVLLPPENAEPVDLKSVLATLGLGQQAGAAPLDVNLATMQFTHAVAAWIDGPVRDALGATAVALRGTGGIVLGALVIAQTVLIAGAAGLIGLYDPPWGTAEDYITVVLVGAAAQAFVQTVVETVQKLLPPMPDQVVTGPAAATVPAPEAAAP